MSYQQQQKTPFCALTLYLRPTGKVSPKFEYKADAKSLFTCSLTKKKYKLSQINEWYLTEGVQNFVKQGYTGKWMAKTQTIETPNKYDQGDTQMVLSFIMIKPYKPQPNVDGMKPIAQTIPQVQQQVAKPDESFDDDLPPF
jgi:hypothetical protein